MVFPSKNVRGRLLISAYSSPRKSLPIEGQYTGGFCKATSTLVEDVRNFFDSIKQQTTRHFLYREKFFTDAEDARCCAAKKEALGEKKRRGIPPFC
jgi:hypothetical protein